MVNEDLDIFLLDHGLPCVCGTTNFLGIKDAPVEEVPSGVVGTLSVMTTILIKTSVVVSAGIKHGTPLLVDSVPYVARNPVAQDDGAFSYVPLSKV